MANAEAGWYPDPSGDATKLRYWDGTQWTDSYAPSQAAYAQPAGAGQSGAKADQGGYAQGSGAQQTGYGQPGYGQGGYTQPGYEQPGYTQPGYGQATYEQSSYGKNINPYGANPVGGMSETDRTLRLIAFIFMVLATVGICWLIIPLAWMIPMTVHCWGIYKGTKANTVAFGVCTLIFCGLISGILLLVSQKDD